MYEIKRFNTLQCAFITGLLSGSGLLLWAIISVMVDGVRVLVGVAPGLELSARYWLVLAFSVVIAPLVAGLAGFVVGFVFSALYNIWAKYAGGIEVDLKLLKK